MLLVETVNVSDRLLLTVSSCVLPLPELQKVGVHVNPSIFKIKIELLFDLFLLNISL